MSKYQNKIKKNKNNKNNKNKNKKFNNYKENNNKNSDKELNFKNKILYEYECDNKEKLFWNVFRGFSGYIRRLILNQIKTTINRYGVYSYDEIKYSEWCIKNNHLELLKIKVANNEPMIFNTSYRNEYNYLEPYSRELIKYYKENNEVLKKYEKLLDLKNSFYYVKYSIFNILKECENDNEQEGYQFFNNLFKNYSNYFKILLNEDCDRLFTRQDESVCKQDEVELPESVYRLNNQALTYQEVLHYVIVFDNLSALKVIASINHTIPLYYSNIYSNFIKAFDIGSLRVAGYLLNNEIGGLNSKLSDDQIKSIWESNVFTNNGDNRINIEKFNFMINNGLVVNNLSPSTSDLEQFKDIISNLFNYQIRLMKFNKFLKSCYFISNLYYNNNSGSGGNNEIKSIINNISISNSGNNNSKYQKLFELKEFKILNLIELDEIKKEMGENEINKEIGEFKIENNNIKLLFNMLLPFSDFKIYNYSFYKAKYYNEYFDEVKDKRIFDPCWFGIYDRNGIGRLPPKQDQYFKYYDDGNDEESKKEKNKEFIKLAIKDLSDSKINEMDKLSRDEIYKLIIYSDDLELFKSVFELFSKGIIGNYYGIIKSTEMFDYIYQETYSCRSMFETILPNYKLINHFKLKYPKDYNEIVLYFPSISNLSYNFSKLEHLDFILENWSDFKNNTSKTALMSILQSQKYNITNSQFSKIIKILKTEEPNFTNLKDDGSGEIDNNKYIYSTLSSFNLYIYILENHSSDLNNGKCLKPNENIQTLAAYFLNNLTKLLLENPKIKNKYLFEEYLIKEIIKRTDLNSLDYIISELPQGVDVNKRLELIVKNSVHQGNIFVYKHLIKNHNLKLINLYNLNY